MRRLLLLLGALALGSCDASGNLTAAGTSAPVVLNGTANLCLLFTSGALSSSQGQVSCSPSAAGNGVIISNNGVRYNCNLSATQVVAPWTSATFTWNCSVILGGA